MIGQKGLPATHGGVEHHVEQLGMRLAERGHEVVVYTRPSYSDCTRSEFLGMTLESAPSLHTKHLDAITHSFVCSLRSRSRAFDIIHYHAIGPCLAAPFAKKSGRAIVATIHGRDWRRAKWGALATLVLRAGEEAALRVPDATISVSKTLAEGYQQRGAKHVHYIPNGVSISQQEDPSVLDEFGLAPGEYALYVGRLVPEKGVHYLVEAWAHVCESRKLVIVGDSSFTDGYSREVRAAAGENVVFPGYLYGARLATAFRRAGLFILPSDLEGLPIVLLEALAYGTPVLASDIDPNREILGENGEYFRAGDAGCLASRLAELLPRMGELKIAAQALKMRALAEYDWDRIAAETESLYRQVLGSQGQTGS